MLCPTLVSQEYTGCPAGVQVTWTRQGTEASSTQSHREEQQSQSWFPVGIPQPH